MNYTAPEMKIVRFESEEVIVASVIDKDTNED